MEQPLRGSSKPPNRTWQVLVLIYSTLALVAGGTNLVSALVPAQPPPPARISETAPQPVDPPAKAAVAPSEPVFQAVIPLGRTAVRVPIVEYHYVRVVTDVYDRLGFNLSVTPADFTAQLDWLASHDYHPVTFAQLRAYFEGKTPLPARPVVLTFDDGYQNFWDSAEPILYAHRFTAVAYIVPGFWGQSSYMTPDEVLALDQSGMVEIGSHTVNHVNLANVSPGNRSYQLAASKSMLERLLAHPVVDFCYPTGRFDGATIAAVDAAGYVTATTQMPGTTLSWATRLVWPRVRASGGESLALWVANLGQPEPTVDVPVAPQ